MASSALFVLIKQILFFCGFWHPKIESKWKRNLFNFYRYFAELLQWCFTVSVFLYTKTAVTGIDEDIGQFAFFIGCVVTEVVTCVKLRFCKRKDVINLLENMYVNEERMNMNRHETIRTVHLKTTERVIFLVKWYLLTISAAVIAVISIAIYFYVLKYNVDCRGIVEVCSKTLLIPAYSPFDVNKYYGLALIYQMFGVIYGGFLLLAMDVLLFAFIMHNISQIKILQHILKNFDQYAEQVSNISMNVQDRYHCLIRSCIREHQKIIRDFEQLNRAVEYIMFIDFLLHSLQVASFTFGTIGGNELSLYNLTSFACLYNTFFQLIFIYWHGNLLREESMKVAEMILLSDWYKLNIKSKRCLMIMIMRTRKPLTLTFGGLYSVNLDVFLKILKTVYTFITLFMRVK